MRVNNWESKLEKVIQETINSDKWVLGKNDCVTFPTKCIEAITNIKVFDTKYKTFKEAKKILKNLRSKDILCLALKSAKEHNFKQIDISKAQRGDILYHKSNKADFNGTLGVCIGETVMFNWDNISLIKKEDCIIAWRIE
tara:strand:+ start:116 stop:535 length:420 start_codon:yes stop_codon:yes gene_type:complete